MSLNKVMLIGNVTKDPEIRTTPTGQNVASFSVATNMNWTDQSGQKQSRAEFHNIVAWRKLADICGQYLHKGTKVYLEGRLQTRDWVAQDGTKKYRTEVIAETMQMLNRPGETQATPSQPDSFEDAVAAEGEEEIKIENIPF